MSTGVYYLHTNGSVIFKRGDVDVSEMRESDFVKAFWLFDCNGREDAWTIAVESLALGATTARIEELKAKWQLTDEDAQYYAKVLHVTLEKDGNQWCAKAADFKDLQNSPAGFGVDCLSALADLATKLGFKGQHIWGHTFKSLCEAAYKKTKADTQIPVD